MKTIRQKGDKDCGVACVAMLSGRSYRDVREMIYGAEDERLTFTKHLHAALVELGRKPLSDRRKGFYSKTPEDLDTDALIFVKRGKKGKGIGHWIVWDAKAKKRRDPCPEDKPYVLKGYLPLA